MTQVFYCSTFFGALQLCAALDAGCFGPHTERRLLITSTNASVPEISMRVDRTPGFDEAVRPRFDDHVLWNDVIAPLHPSGWSPPAAEIPLLSRWLRAHLALDDTVRDLVLESISVPPARTIATLVPGAAITVFSDGLMGYGPTRNQLSGDVSTRIERLLYLDLVPGVRPLLLRETRARARAIPQDRFAEVIATVPKPAGVGHAGDSPIIIGQYLSSLGIVTPVREDELHAQMLRGLVARGHRRVVFKPHPVAGPAHVLAMRAAAVELDVDLIVAADVDSAEAWFAAARPQLVVSCFSTALFTAARLFGLDVATLGCDTALAALRPYQDSNRIPATIVDASLPRLGSDGSLTRPPPVDLDGLVRAVGYCMQPEHGASLREDAAAYVQANGAAPYFKRRRLESLGLVHQRPRRLPRARRAYRRVRALMRVDGGARQPAA